MASFPKTIRAAKRADGSQWAIGDALIDECGLPERSNQYKSAKAPAPLHAVAAELAMNGLEYATDTLQTIRATAAAFPMNRRNIQAPFSVYSLFVPEEDTPAQREKFMQQILQRVEEDNGKITRDAVRKALGLKPAGTQNERLTLEEDRERMKALLKDEDEAFILMQDHKVRANLVKANREWHEDAEDSIRRELPDAAEASDNADVIGAFQKLNRAARQAVRSLEGVRLTKMMRNVIVNSIEDVNRHLDFVEDTLNTKGTIGEEVEAFLETVNEGE